jgi:hypothetical protein
MGHDRRTSERRTSDRWTSAQKASAVLRLLKGEPVEAVGEELRVSVRRLERWQLDFITGGTDALVKPHRAHRWFKEHSGSILQWVGLLLALLVAIVLLEVFLHSGSPE